MRPPLTAVEVLHENGSCWELRDRRGKRIAAYLSAPDAKLLAALINQDYMSWQTRWSDSGEGGEITDVMELER